ncbi:MAG: glycosyl hydrolase, partial [Candidatus Aminicenantes bacterium]|nr:glycosyl hydrolase [Candidatus Aminicenantes bacterium]
MSRFPAWLLAAALVGSVSLASSCGGGKPKAENRTPPAPLYRDPVFDGAADPSLIWNDAERAWWVFYTNRRANAPDAQDGVRWCHGTDIGIASSADGGLTWTYRGTAQGLEFE